MKEEIKTWRELLGKVIANNSHERHRIAHALNVNSITLMRWVSHKSNPRQDNLRLLLDALPEHREQLINLIVQEYPHFFTDKAVTTTIREVPSAFYARVLNTHITTPPLLRTSSVCILILQQILGHLDPYQSGMAAIIVQCVPPRIDGQKIRSLRKTLGRGLPPWGSHTENTTQFFGIESQAGHAAIVGHPVIVQSQQEKMRLFPAHHSPFEESTVAFPILRSERIAGALCIASTQPNYFTQTRLDLIQNYVDLLVLAFDQGEFYDLHNLELGIMPPRVVQQPLLATFQRRVTQHIIQATQNGQSITRTRAELLAWQELEEELLHQESTSSE